MFFRVLLAIMYTFLYLILLGALRKLHPAIHIKECKAILLIWFDGAKDHHSGRKRRSAYNV